jgi:hypothetical protein
MPDHDALVEGLRAWLAKAENDPRNATIVLARGEPIAPSSQGMGESVHIDRPYTHGSYRRHDPVGAVAARGC